MTNRTVKHEIKLPKYLIVLLAMMVIGLFANVFSPTFSIKEASAQALDLSDYSMIKGGFSSIAMAIQGIAACRM